MASMQYRAAALFLSVTVMTGACGHDSFVLGPTCKRGEALPCYTGPESTRNVGACRDGGRVCNDDLEGFSPYCAGEVRPVKETCATPVDDDCDGEVNERDGDGCVCTSGQDVRPCYSGPAGTGDVGICRPGVQACELGLWGVCGGDTLPGVEDCRNAEDDDCDGIACAAPVWAVVGGDTKNQTVTAVAADESGSAFVAGTFGGKIDWGGGTFTAGGFDDAFVMKLDAGGAHLWSRALGAPAGRIAALAVVGDDVVIAGSFLGQSISLDGIAVENRGATDVLVARLDGSSGKAKWAVALGESGHQRAAALAVRDGRVALAGSFDGVLTCASGAGCTPDIESAGNSDAFVAMLDAATGALLEARAFGGAADDQATAVAIDPAGRTILAGSFHGVAHFDAVTLLAPSPPVHSDAFVAVLGADLKTVWANGYGDITDQEAQSLALDASGSFVVAGRTEGEINFGDGVSVGEGLSWWAVKLNGEGIAQWAKTLPGAVVGGAAAVAFAQDGTLALVGEFRGATDLGGGELTTAPEGSDAFVVKLAADGSFIWGKQFGAAASDDAWRAVAVTAKGRVLAGGALGGPVDFGPPVGTKQTMGGADAAAVELEP